MEQKQAFQDLNQNTILNKAISRQHQKLKYHSSTSEVKNGKLYLPKIGFTKSIFHREIDGIVKTVTVSKEADRYFASINYEDNIDCKETIIMVNQLELMLESKFLHI